MEKANKNTKRERRPRTLPLIVTVCRNRQMYARCIAHNPYMASATKVLIDNEVKNLGIPKRYNAFLDSYDYAHPTWLIFCHEDWQLKQDLTFLRTLDKNTLYGPIGVHLEETPTKIIYSMYGQVVQSDKDGGRCMQPGISISQPTPVETFDCQCLIVHSDLIKKHHLRFDEHLTYDLYIEDFCMAAKERFSLKSYVIPLACQHYSYGKLTPLFHQQLAYLQNKYKNARRVYGSTVNKIIIGTTRKKIKYAGTTWTRRVLRFLYYQKITQTGYLSIKICKLPICHKKIKKNNAV